MGITLRISHGAKGSKGGASRDCVEWLCCFLSDPEKCKLSKIRHAGFVARLEIAASQLPGSGLGTGNMPTPGPYSTSLFTGGRASPESMETFAGLRIVMGFVFLPACYSQRRKIWIQGPGRTLAQKEISSVSSWITHHLTCSCTCTRLLVTSRPNLFQALQSSPRGGI